MSALDRYLASTELLDCQGRVDYELTLELDGRVRVHHAGTTVRVEPATGFVEPPGFVLADHVLHAAAELAGVPTRAARRRR